MHPILVKFGPVTIPTYGFFVAAGFLLGLALAIKKGKEEGVDPSTVSDLVFYILIGTIIGARVYFVVEHWGYFVARPWEMLYLWRGGLAFFGGFLGAFLFAVYFVYKKKLKLWFTADLIAPSIPAGHAVGRLGCFSAGCCYGKPCTLPWSVTFTDPHSLARLGVPLHPTQLYSVAANILIFTLLWWLYPRRKFEGQVFFSYVLLYGLARFIIEFFRGDPRTYIGPFSIPQYFSILGAIVAVAMLLILRRKALEK